MVDLFESHRQKVIGLKQRPTACLEGTGIRAEVASPSTVSVPYSVADPFATFSFSNEFEPLALLCCGSVNGISCVIRDAAVIP